MNELRSKLIFIDAMRGWLSVLVLVSHVVESVHNLHDGSVYLLKDHGFYSTLGNGGFWVGGFFVLSGFCIHRSVRSDLSAGTFSFWSYLQARFWRIYPLFLIGLLLATGVWFCRSGAGEGHLFPSGEFIGSLFLMQHVTGTFPHYGPSWSLTNEWFYYLFWPLMLWICAWREKAALAVGAAAGLGLAFAFWLGWRQAQGTGHESPLSALWVTWACVISWLAGAWLAVHWDRFGPKTERLLTLACWMLPVCYGVNAFLLYKGYSMKLQMPFIGLSSLAFCGLIFQGCRAWRPTEAQEKRARFLGDLSYPLYLFHLPVLALLEVTFVRFHFLPAPVFTYLILSVVTLLFCGTIGVWLERFFLAWRRQRFLQPMRKGGALSKAPEVAS